MKLIPNFSKPSRRRNKTAVQPRKQPQVGQNRTFSYYANRSQTDSNTGRETVQSKPPLRRLPTKIRTLRQHFGWLLAAVACTGFIVYELQLSAIPNVVSLVQAADAPFLQDTSVYVQAASKLFSSSAANRNKLTVDSSSVATELKKQFPELQDVVVSLPLVGDRATVYVRPATPALLLSSAGRSYIIDSNGRAISESTSGSSATLSRLNIPTVTDQSGVVVQIGTQVLPRSATAFVSTVVGQLRAKQEPIQSLTLPVSGSELNAYISNRPYFVKFNMHDADIQAAALQAGTYLAVSKQLSEQGITPNQYIDVRLEGRAYYK